MATAMFDILKVQDKLPEPKWNADSSGSPVILVTGCSVTKFDETTFECTKTKAWFPGNDEYFCNVSLPMGLKAAESGHRVVLQCSSKHLETLRSLVQALSYAEHIHVLAADLGSPAWLSDLEDLLAEMASDAPISRLDAFLYESYTADVNRPFLPTWEEKPETIGNAIARRITFFQYMANYMYDLVLRRGQNEIRVQAMTALAGFRPIAYLFGDGSHKVVSSKFLQTWALEAVRYVDVPVSIIELAPGIVDTGLYDPLEIREVSWEKAELGHAPFTTVSSPKDFAHWPMISPWDIATISQWYVDAEWGQAPGEELSAEVRALLSAGREPDVVIKKVREAVDGTVSQDLPLYAYFPGYPWGSMPALKTGYIPVFITPPGHFV